MRTRAFVLALVLALAGAGIAALAMVVAQQPGEAPPPPGLEDVPRRAWTPIVINTDVPLVIPTPATPSDETSPRSCLLGDHDVEGTVAFEMTRRYGELRHCGLFGETWVVTTLGWRNADGLRHGGVVGLYPCESGDDVCLDNESPHPFANWTFIRPPFDGGVSILSVPDDHTLRLGVGNGMGAGRAYDLDLVTRELTLVGSSAPQETERARDAEQIAE